MNFLMYYGGFGLGGSLFLAAVIFFIVFKIPSVHRYFKRNSKKGLAAAAITKKKHKAPKGPKRVTREEYENRTEIMLTGPEANDPGEAPPQGALAVNVVDEEATELLDQTMFL